MECGYGIPVSRSLEEAVNSLQYTERLVSDTMSQIEERISSSTTSIHALEARIEAAGVLIQQVSTHGKQKPTAVFSSSHLPSPQELPAFKALFHKQRSHPAVPVYVPNPSTEYFDSGPGSDLSSLVPDNRLGIDLMEVKLWGLGPTGHCNLDAVSDAMLFNSDTHVPGRRYRVYDNLQHHAHHPAVAGATIASDSSTVQPAPLSITLLQGHIRLPQPDDIHFRPDFAPAPSIPVPRDLELPGIADVHAEFPKSGTIGFAPSREHQLSSQQAEHSPPNPPASTQIHDKSPVPSSPVTLSSKCPPPPPPPPAPPVPTRSPPTPASVPVAAPKPPAPKKSISSAHDDLFSQIRNPNVSLKKISRDFEGQKKKKLEAADDPMAELKRKMKAMRSVINPSKGVDGLDEDDEDEFND